MQELPPPAHRLPNSQTPLTDGTEQLSRPQKFTLFLPQEGQLEQTLVGATPSDGSDKHVLPTPG